MPLVAFDPAATAGGYMRAYIEWISEGTRRAMSDVLTGIGRML